MDQCRFSGQEEDRLYQVYVEVRMRLQEEIGRARTESRDQMIAGIDQDPHRAPFGILYRMVLGRLRAWASQLTQTLQPDVLRGVHCRSTSGGERAQRGSTLISVQEYRPGLGRHLQPGANSSSEHSRAQSARTIHCLSGSGHNSTAVEDMQVSPHQEGRAPQPPPTGP